MKSLLILFVSMSLLVVIEQSCSQDKRTAKSEKPLNNPMYSTNNYKQPNMATVARRWEPKEGIAVRKPAASDAQLANYKQQMPLAEPVGGIMLTHTPSGILTDRNYKIQRLSEPHSFTSTSEYYGKKQPIRKPGSTAVGK